MAGEKIVFYVVWTPVLGPIVGYVRLRTAQDHARSMLGGRVDECELRDQLAPVVIDDVYVAELEGFDEDPTPVEQPKKKR